MHLNIEKERVWVKTKTYKRFAMATASAALVGSAIVPVASAAPYYRWIQDYPFKDVPEWSSHYINVLEANELSVMTGYSDGTFKPNQQLNRGNVAKVFGKYVVTKSGMTLDEYVREHNIAAVENFDDVPDDWADAELVTYSKIVKDAGIFEGSNNKLNAAKLMPRDQIAEVIVRAFGFEAKGDLELKYADQSAYAKSIAIILDNGVSQGYPYRPLDTTSRSQFASFMVRAVKVSEGLDTEEPYPFPIKSVQGLAELTINLGEMPKLPETVEVTLNSGLKSTAAVDWNTDNLNNEEVGSYILTGNLAGTDLTASIKVNVREPQYKRVRKISIDNNVIKISYPQNMSKTTTLDLSNYRFNGGPMPEGTRIDGEAGYVTITLPLPEDPISADMEYTFEITQNVKTINSDIIVGNSFAANNGTEAPKNVTVTGVFHDNVAPALVSADYVITAPGGNTSNKIQLTFSEDIAHTFYDTSSYDEDDPLRERWEEINASLAERLESMMSLKIGGTEAHVGIGSYRSWNGYINGNKVYVSIPETNIDQTSTLTIVPEEVKHNEEPVLTDDSLGKNPLAETFTKIITKENVVVIP